MADGSVTITVDVDGKQIKDLNKDLDSLTKKGQEGGRSLKEFALGGVAFKLASAGVDLLKQSLDSAIRRFDTLQKFPRVMKAMGHSTEDVTRATQKLANGIEGLPTTLDEVIGTAQRLTSVTGNLRQSTNLTLALNNAFLASGSSSADASRGLQQYTQMLSAGKVDMQSWKTLQETMPYALQKTAESFGFAGKSAQNDFYAALREGRISFDQFSSRLIELNAGVGGFAELAKENSKGIATSFGNLKNAVAKGVAGTIEALDTLSKAVTGKSIAENFDSLKVVINAGFKVINAGIKVTIPIFQLLFNVVRTGIGVLKALSPVLTGIGAGLVTLKVLTTIVASVNAFRTAWTLSALALANSSSAIALTTATLKIGTAAEKAALAVRLTSVGVTNAIAVAQGILTGAISLSTVATVAYTTAVTVLKAALTALTGPVGLVVAGIGALVAAGTALWSWLTKESEETKRLKEEQEGLVNSNKALVDSVTDGIRTRKENRDSIQGNSKAYKKLADEIVVLSQKERLSAGEKRHLKQKIDALNGSIEGLNLAYDKNSGKLSHNTSQIHARIDALEAEDTWKTSQQNLLDIEAKRAEIQRQLGEITQQRTKWNEEANVSDGIRKEKIAELTEQEKLLNGELSKLQEEYEATSQVQQAAAEAMATAAENGVNRQVLAYENLSEQQRTVVDNMRAKFQELQDTTTNMFDVIEQKSALSIEQMSANLEQNRLAVEQWSSNLKILAQRGVDQGIIEELRKMGPEGAAQTQVFVNATDTELQGLQEKWRSSTEAAKTAMGDVMDSAGIEIPEKVKTLVTNISSGLQAELTAADFSSLGQEIPSAIGAGVDAGAETAAQSTSRVAQKMKDLFMSNLGIHSPSTVFKGYGRNVTEGLSIGLDGGTSTVSNSMTKLQQMMVEKGQAIVEDMKTKAKEMANAFSTLNDDLYSHGSNAMAGLANGISQNSGSALAAAEAVASQIKATIQRALDIHSPSRVMRDEVGRFIPQGIAVGIEADADEVSRSMQKLRQHMIIREPELALGVQTSLTSATIKYQGKQTLMEKVELVLDKTSNQVAKALEIAEQAVKRPVEMRFDDGTLVAKTYDKFGRAIARQTETNDRMWGRI